MFTLNKIILLFSGLLTALMLQAQPVMEYGALQVKGKQLTAANGRSVILRGVSFGWHNWWPRFYNAGAVQTLQQDWKADVVRAAIGVEPNGGYLKDPKGSVEKARAVIDAAIAANIYVIIDWHSHNINLEAAKEFFTEMAKSYGNKPHVIYEIFNEPDDESWPAVKAYAEELIKTIRAIDPDNIILVGTPHWDQDVHLAAADPIRGQNNLMYTLHFYAATHKQALRDRATQALAKGLPLFISESAGMEASGNGPLNETEWQAWIDWAEKNKVSWITWSISDKNETCSMLQAGAPANGGWTEAHLKPSGIKTKALLRRYAVHILR